MSILIKGQELPISCGDCMKLFLTEGRNRCPFLWRSFDSNNEYQDAKRMPNCPLVDVPDPHGDLINRDVVKDDIIHRLALKHEIGLLPAEKTIYEAMSNLPR